MHKLQVVLQDESDRIPEPPVALADRAYGVRKIKLRLRRGLDDCGGHPFKVVGRPIII